MIVALQTLLAVLRSDSGVKKFGLGVVLGMGFSISVILATIGIMDGFESSLKVGLRRAVGDVMVYSRSGFFKAQDELGATFNKLNVTDYAPMLRSEAFLIIEEASKGVQISGVEQKSFNNVTGMKLSLLRDEVAIGKELAEQFEVGVGDEIVLALAKGNKQFSSLPFLIRFKVGQIVSHGIYQKDLRIVYMDRERLQEALNLGVRVNAVALNAPGKLQFTSENADEYTEQVELFERKLENEIGIDFYSRAFWEEYTYLLDAVEVEKLMIGLVLQLVVIISIFNVLAFIIYINEKKSREIFLFKALGISQAKIAKVWLLLGGVLWILACVISLGFVWLINYALQNFSFLELPGEIYYLARLSINLDPMDYFTVFSAALIWLLVISYFALLKMKRRPIIYGLRKEFA